jgi:hypothetical protein
MCGNGAGTCACYQVASQDVVCAAPLRADACEHCNFDDDYTAQGPGFCIDNCRCESYFGSCIYRGNCPNPAGILEDRLKRSLPVSRPRRRRDSAALAGPGRATRTVPRGERALL